MYDTWNIVKGNQAYFRSTICPSTFARTILSYFDQYRRLIAWDGNFICSLRLPIGKIATSLLFEVMSDLDIL